MEELLLKLKAHKGSISVIEDNLKISVPKGFNDSEFINELKENKESLIKYIKEKRSLKKTYEAIPKAAQKASYKLTPPQLRLFLLNQLNSDTLAYNLPGFFWLEGAIDYNKFEQAFINLIERHESLRTSFCLDENNEPVQKIIKDFSFKLEHFEGNESNLNTIIDEFVKPFQLDKTPLLRVGLISVSKDRHILLFDIHHIISDGTSTGILIKELVQLYSGQDLPELSLQYKDFSEWYLGDDYQASVLRQKDFWNEEFNNTFSPIELPLDFQRPKERMFGGSSEKFSLSRKETEQLQEISYKNNTTLFTVLLGIYGVMLSKLSNNKDVVIGTPVAGRKHADLQGLIGMFVNTLALPLHISADFSFTAYIKELHEKVLTFFDNADYPYEKLINDLQIERDPSRNPLFDVIFAFQNMDKESMQMENLQVREYERETTTTKFDLILDATEESSVLNFNFEYSTELFSTSTIQKFIRFFKSVIKQVLHNEEVLLSEISLLSKNDEKILIDFEEVNYPKADTLVSLFEEQVERNPNKEALVFEDTSLTYFELNNLANTIAENLKTKGVGPDSIVGLLMDKDLYTVPCLLGILKSGGCYLPIDPSYPKERINYMVQDSDLNILVTNKTYEDLIETSIDKIVLENAIEDLQGKKKVENPERINNPEDLCYIIYTSGTTGNPKGVMVEHKNVVRLLFNDKFQFDFSENDIWTMFHSHCFDVSVWEMYGSLLYGGKLIIVSQNDARDPLRYLEILKENGVTVLNQTPTAFDSLKNACKKEGILLPNIRYVVFAGEALTPLKLKEWNANHPKAKLINMYGITEVTVHTTYKEIGKEEIENNISNIGKPIPTSSVYLLDENQNLVPQGVIGELYVVGDGVTRGYLNKEELTTSRFIKNPYQEDQRLYRSGDLGRLLSNGEIEYLGRIDKQVQLKGFRIELKEIEHHLLLHELIDETVVIKRDSEQNQPYLCAYYIGKEDIEVNSLRTYLGERLPHYMIPSYFVRLDEIPFTTNNKVAVAKLPEPNTGLSSLNYVAPTNERECLLCEIWGKELGLEQVGIRDNFFSLGGDSLKAIGLMSTINKELKTSLTIADLYSHQTIQELIMIQDSKNIEEEEQVIEAAREELRLFQKMYKEENGFSDSYEEVFPMNGVEMGMIFYSLQTKSDNIHEILYHEQNLYDIPEKDFDFERFKKTIELLSYKHGELRKIFDIDNLAHIIKKEVDPEINFIDICHLSKEEQESFINQKMHDERLKGTELSFSVIWRMNIIKIREDYQYLLFDFNHALFDGWSLSSFLTEMQKIYLNLLKDKNYCPKKLQSSYEDQIVGELAASKKESSIQYWKEELDDYTRFELQPTGLEHEFFSDEFKFGKAYRKELEVVAKKYNTTFKHLCFSAYVYTLRALSYGSDITTGIATNIRPLVEDAEQLLGCFLNTIPFRVNIPEGLTWREYIYLVESKLRELKYHERVPFHKILKIAEEERSEKNPIFDVFFNYVDFRIFEEMESAEEGIEEEETKLKKDYLNDHALLTTHVFAHENDFNFILTYSTSFITKDQAEVIASYFKNTLNQFIYHADTVMDKQVILEETSYLLNIQQGSTPINVEYPETATLVSLFENQVVKTPHKEAIVFDDQSLTYSELNNLANALAEELRLKGIGRDSIVGLLMDKNLHTVVCQLGILKAGGCYLPIDPSYPKDRIDYILDDSNLNILVTNKAHENVLDTSIYQVVLEDVLGSLSGEEVSNPEPINYPKDLCYIIYTSGTTGKPKGVMVEHGNVVRLFFNDEFQFEFGEEDVWTMFHSHCFDFSVWEMYGALLYGGKLVMVSQEDARDPFRYMELLKEHKVTVLNQTPTAFDSLKTACTQEDTILSDLRYVVFGGEALTPLKLKDWYANHPDVKLVNMYGITEITVHATYKEIRKEEIENNISNIGAPIPTTSMFILDSDKNLQPQGVIGEIYIGGLGVTRGYLNKEELTAARFIKNPFYEGERLYRSGDLGRLLENGEVEYLGRIDNQVQLKGFRIELKEIEYHLLRHKQIEESVVVLKDSDKDQPYLCAYYVSKGAVEINDFRTYLGEYLPNYMIPSYFVRLEEMPFTSNNKIAISKLPEPESGVAINTYVAPANDREALMCNVWARELDVEKVGVRDNYFSLGGDSLRAIGLISAMNKELEASFTIADLYSYQTIEELMSVQNSGKEENEAASEAAIAELRLFQKRYKEENGFSDSYEEVYPMNGVEMGMIFHSLQTKSDNIHEILYHEQNLYDMPEKDFDFDRFRKVIRLIYQKHGELRKIFDLDNLAHIIKKEIDPEINFIDICHLDKEDQELFITQKMHEERLRGTDLSFSVIWRMNVIKIRADYQYLLFDFNHALFDGWSLSSFMTELQKTYLSLSEDENYVPKKLLSSYEDQILGELTATKKESTIAYWKNELDGYTRFELPPTGLKHEYLRDEFTFGKEYRKQLEKVAEKHNTSFKHLCFSAYIYMLRMFSYGTDITAGITTNIRPLVQDAEQLLGCFLNTIPFRAQIPDGLTWGGYIDFIENKLRELKYHEQAPFHKILEMVKEVSSEKNPIFDVSFNYVDFRVFKELQSAEETIEEEQTTISKAYMNDYALLGVHIRAFDNDFGLEFDYSTSFITEEQAKTLSNCFKNILDQFIHNADILIDKNIILEENSDSLKTIENFNNTTVTYEKDKTVLDLFKEQVALAPGAEALIYEDDRLSYGELDIRSDIWTRHLLNSHGIKPGSIVGVRMTRSIEMVTAILAIMKAGASFMVIDPELPSSRTTHMIDESGCSCIITNINRKPIGLDSYSWINVEELEQSNDSKNNEKLPNVTLDSSAYILYTSGSTGKPKGCMISHANLFNYIFWSNNYYFKNTEDGNWGLMTPMSFDLSITAIFTSLTRGKKLSLYNETSSIDQLLQECFTNPAIDTLKITPTHVTILKDLEIPNTNIKTIICGGEQLKKVHIEILKNINENIKVYNEYGPTETTVGCTVTEVKIEDNNISVGSPIANTKLHILDAEKKTVPIGVVGEMYVSGAGVSKGYIGNDLLTSERFIQIDDSICYKTGDLGRWNSDGNIEYVGRIDDQIKIRGLRIELGEIEAELERFELITQAFVTDYGEDENKQLCAYLIGDEGINSEQLKRTLSQVLPAYMIPSAFICIDEFPLTSNGKIDKKLLPLPDHKSGEEYVAPTTSKEHQMVRIWSEILELDASEIGMNDNFFKLGGHSLSTVKLKNRINKELSIAIELKSLFTYSTIRFLLDHISNLEETQFASIPKAPEKQYYPLSSEQNRMYFLYEFDKESISYNMPSFYRIDGELDVSKFEFAFKELVARHQSFRTIFELEDGVPVQRILDAGCFEITYSSGETSHMKKHIADFVQPFDLAKEIPVRVSLMEVSGEFYLLSIDNHHIMNDGFSKEILMREFWSLYRGDSLEPLKIQYTDYAVWQQSEAHQKLVSDHKSYWLDLYDEDVTTLELPTDYPRLIERNDQGGVHRLELTKTQSAKLRDIASSEGVTMYMLFLAIYNVLLSKLSNQDDIVVGTPTAGRHHSDLESLVGMFVNTLALRNRVDSDVSFKDFLGKIQENTLMAFDHQMYQYEELVDTLDLSRDALRNPLFDIFFSYSQKFDDSDFSDSDIKIVSHDTVYNTVKFDLELDVLDSEEISLSLTYRTDLFNSSSIVRFSEYLERIITSILEDNTQLLRDISILSEKERDQLLIGFNDTAVDYDLKQTVLDMFISQSLLNPNAEALVLGDERLTYKDLDSRSNKWASSLIDSGVISGSIVGLMMNRSTEMITAILAIMKAGGAYLPMNPDQPLHRTINMLEEGDSSVVMTNLSNVPDELRESYNCIEVKNIDCQNNSQDINKLICPSSEDLAYIIYTSGSTGKPKGVMIKHESLSNLIQHQKELFKISNEERILMFSPYYFDASIEQLWLALSEGATLVLIEEEVLVDANKLNIYLRDEKVTHLDSTPSFLERIDIEDLPALRRVVSGGEACKNSLAQRISSKYPFYNVYGPTEATVTSTVHRISKSYSIEDKVSIGHPIANTQAYILGDRMNLLPHGVKGELYLGGKGLSSGYLKRPDLTEERFVNNPFGDGRLYKTGDLVRWLSDGTIEYLGRNDDQVKIRGIRIELGEIESQLEDIDSVSQALVIAYGSENNKQLIAYLCGEKELDGNEIKSLLSSKLPDYMIPTAYIWLDAFPLNANDKIDKKALPNPDLTIGEDYVAPENENQQKLVEIWSEVLDIDGKKIGITSDFFNLGGHSLTAITLVNNINKVFSVNLPLRDLFVYRTISQLSEHIFNIDKVSFVAIQKAPEEDYYPLSSAQRRMYVLYEFDKNSTVYNMPVAYQIEGNLDIDRIQSSVLSVIKRHESLRTVFKSFDNNLVQQILSWENFKMSFKESSEKDAEKDYKDFVQPFNLEKDYPVRVCLLNIAKDKHVLLLDFHHIVGDLRSSGILTSDFLSYYKGEDIPNLALQYKDYAVWQNTESQLEIYEKDKAFWISEYKAPVYALDLPADYERPLAKTNRGSTIDFTLDKEMTDGLKTMSNQIGGTLFMGLFGMFNILLSKLSNNDDIVIGTPVAGRQHADLENIVGLFLNILAVRNHVDGDQTVKEFLFDVKNKVLECMDSQSYQYDELIDDLGLSRNASRNPLFDVMFVFEKAETGIFQTSDLIFEEFKNENTTSKFDLLMTCIENNDELHCRFEYYLDIFKPESIQNFITYFKYIVSQIVKNSGIKISELNLLNTKQQLQIVNQFNKTNKDYKSDKTIHELFEAQVQKTPDAIGLDFMGNTLTYQKLNEQANQLARVLRKKGISKNGIVGVMQNRSLDMVVSILAIFKAGGAYLPIDPDYPINRIDKMIGDSGMQLLLSDVALIPSLEEKVPYLNVKQYDYRKEESSNLPSVNSSEDLLYVIYTSGSTGVPKGLMVNHGNLTNLMDYHINSTNIETSSVLQFTTLTFDPSFVEIFSALLTGGKLFLIEEIIATNFSKLLSHIQSNEIKTIYMPSSVLNQMFNSKFYLDQLPSCITNIITAGEQLIVGDLFKKYLQNNSVYLHNYYGPAETQVVTANTINPKDTIPAMPHIGRPIQNTQIYILNENMQQQPVNFVGELYVGGDQVGDGYLSNQKLTRERFINNPFKEGDILYKTGDLARWLPDGNIEFLGRSDTQVKLNGVRIEPGEIESHLSAMDTIADSAVVVKEVRGNKSLVAYYVAEENISISDIRAALIEKLPLSMIPSYYVHLQEMPLTATGKLSRNSLPLPEEKEIEYKAPSNKAEEQLVTIWSEVLDLDEDQISVNRSFFELGGNSLKAITLINKISKILMVEVNLKEIFVKQTIQNISEYIITIKQMENTGDDNEQKAKLLL